MVPPLFPLPSFPTSQTLRRGRESGQGGEEGEGRRLPPPPPPTWPGAQAWVPSMPWGCLGPEEGGEGRGEAENLKDSRDLSISPTRQPVFPWGN